MAEGVEVMLEEPRGFYEEMAGEYLPGYCDLPLAYPLTLGLGVCPGMEVGEMASHCVSCGFYVDHGQSGVAILEVLNATGKRGFFHMCEDCSRTWEAMEDVERGR